MFGMMTVAGIGAASSRSRWVTRIARAAIWEIKSGARHKPR